MMTFRTWKAIADRLVWYRDEVLTPKIDEWPTERIKSCTDLAILQRAIELTERMERHQLRMDRHMQRAHLQALVASSSPSNRKH
jgi:hypothetical protein